MSQATLALHAPEEAAEPAAASPTPNGRSGRVIAVASLAVLVVVWFAPAIVARSGLRHGFVHAVLPAYAGEAEVGHASLGWLSPIVLREIALSDADGRELLRVEEFRTSQHLLALLAGRSNDFGVLTLTRPELSVRLKSGGSNAEELLAPLLEGEGSGSGFEVRVVDGTVAWTRLDGDPAAGSLKDLSATISRAAGTSLPDHIELGGTLTDGEHSGTLAVRSVRHDRRDAAPQISVVAKDLPLGGLQSWLDRFEIAGRVTGAATADVVITAPIDGSSWNVDGRVAGRRMRFERAGVDDAHPLLIEEASLAGRASADGSLLTLDDLELTSDVGTATVNGSFDLGTLFSENAPLPQVKALLANEFSLKCSADLKTIAAALPESLRLRQPVQSGTLAIDVKSFGEEGRRQGTIRLRASDIVAGSAENPIVWRQPFAFDLVASQTASGLTVENAHAESEFLTLRGAGSATAAELTFDTDLDRLRENLSRFVELSADALAGRAEGRITVKRGAADKIFDVAATGAVRDLMLSLAGRRWTERELSFHASAECVGDLSGLTEIRSGTISLQSIEKDEVRAVLKEPVQLGATADWRLAATAKGDSARWFNRARAWRLLPEATSWTIAGQIDAKAEVAFAGSLLQVSGLDAESKNFRLGFANRMFDEPVARLTGDASWNLSSGLLTVPTARFTSESATIDGTGIEWPLTTDEAISGRFEIRGGIGRLARYVMPSRPPIWVSGVVQGTADLKSDATATLVDAKFAFERPVLTKPLELAGGRVEWRPLWSDDRAEVSLTARYHRLGDALDVTAIRIVASGIGVDAKGRLDHVSSSGSADLTGSLSYDLPMLAPRIHAWPAEVIAKGQGAKPFALRGPLFGAGIVDPALTASAGLGWDSLDVYGLGVGSGELLARLERGTLEFEPFDWPVGNGRARGSASAELNGRFPLRLAPGRVVDSITITPEMCRRWLCYAAPTLADAATVLGTASLDVASCTMPLSAPTETQAEATLLIAELDATPGPFARSLINVIGQIQRIAGRDATSGSDLRLVAPQQAVRLRIAGGRVHHDRFTVRLGDADGPIVSTSGSVGFDESLDLVAEIPLDATWFKDDRLATALGGQSLRVPIRGTLSRPAPDPRALQDLARRAATGAVNGVLNREIEKQVGDPLRKLLDRRPTPPFKPAPQ